MENNAMDDLSKPKPRNELTGVQGPRRRFFEAPAAEAGKGEGRGLGDEEREVQAESTVEGAPVKWRGGSDGVPDAPRHRHLELSATTPAGGPLVKAGPAPPRQRNFVVPIGPPGLPISMLPERTVRERRFEMLGTPPAEGVLVTPTVRQRNFEMPAPAEGPLVSGNQSGDTRGTPEEQVFGLPWPKVRARKFETPGVLTPAGPAPVVQIVPAEPHIGDPSEPNVPPPSAGVMRADAVLHPGPRRRDFVMAGGSELPSRGKSVEPRTLQDIEASPDSGVEVPLSIFVDQLIDDSRPMDAKLKYYTPPPEAQRLMVRNIARRFNGATHPLEGYYTPQDPSNIHFDNTQYPDNFEPPLISYHTEDQLKNVHWKVESADYNTSTYQEKLHFVKGARLTQLEWELNNINLLGEIGKELQECKDELLPLVLQ